MSYTKRVLRGLSVVLVFTVLTNVIGYLHRLYLGRVLSTEDFGLVFSILALFGLIMFFVYMGFTESGVKFVTDYLAKKKEKMISKTISSILTAELALSLLVSLVFATFASAIAVSYFGRADATLLLYIYLVAMCLSPLEAVLIKLFQSYQRMTYYSTLQFGRSVVLLLLTVGILTVWPELGVLGAIIAYPITTALAFSTFYPIFKYNVSPNLHISPRNFDKKLLKRIFIYGIPITLTTLSGTILVYTDTIMITAFRPLDEVGLYNAALPTANILKFLGTGVFTVFFPLVAELWTKKKIKLLSNVLGEALVLLTATIVPLALLFFVFPDIVLNILFGGKFVPAGQALSILAISSIFATLSMFSGSVLSGIGKPHLTTKAVIAASIFNVLANLWLIPRIGFVGAAYATLIAQVFMFLAKTYYVWKDIQFQFPVHKLLLIMVAGGVLVPLLNWLRDVVQLDLIPKLLVVLVVLSVVYGSLILLMRVVTLRRMKELANEFL